MSRFTIGLIVAASLTLTAYFGAAAWRASDDRHSDITGSIAPAGDFEASRRLVQLAEGKGEMTIGSPPKGLNMTQRESCNI